MLFEVDLELTRGERTIAIAFTSDAPVTALVGPSGAGKTTILNMTAGIARPARGRIAVGGQVLYDPTQGIDLPPERRRCGYVFQDNRLFPHLDVRRNLMFGRRLAPEDAHWAPVEEVVELLGLAPLLARHVGSLSGGEARRVAIGRALLAAPAFLLLDEPLTSLDRARREDLLAAIERVRDRFALPTLYVSHQQEEVARLAGQVVEIAAR